MTFRTLADGLHTAPTPRAIFLTLSFLAAPLAHADESVVGENLPAEKEPAATTTTTTTETAVPADLPPTSQPNETPSLVDEAAAQKELDRCVAMQQTHDAFVKCLQDLEERSPTSSAAERARGMRQLLTARAATTMQPEKRGLFAPGRLEIASAFGVFGVWNAVAAGILLQTNVPDLDPGITLLGTSVLALGAGIGGGYAGIAIADAMHLSEGGARLTASGLVWGTNMGVPLSLWMQTLVKDPVAPWDPVTGYASPKEEDAYLAASQAANRTRANILLVGTVLAGYAGGGAALALATQVDVTPADVSMINSGGAIGSVVGVLAISNLTAVADVNDTGALASTYIGSNLLGLGAGAMLAQKMELTWGQTLIGDLGAVVGGVACGFGAAGGLALAKGDDAKAATMIATGSIAAGTIGGYAAGLWIASKLSKDATDSKDSNNIHASLGAPLPLAARPGEMVFSTPSLMVTW